MPQLVPQISQLIFFLLKHIALDPTNILHCIEDAKAEPSLRRILSLAALIRQYYPLP